MSEDNNFTSNESIERFRNELKKPLRERYLSEEELALVFDLAGDEDDNYIQTEALILGARLYPDSLRMLERRAIHYLESEPPLVFKNFMADNEDAQSNLLDIIRLNLLDAEPVEQLEKKASEILSTIEFSEDEEVIQLMKFAQYTGLSNWLKDNFETLKRKAPYLPTVLYEYGYMATELMELAELSVKAMEELTELEPYDCSYWNLLAIAYMRVDRMDDALSAIEYALAIDPSFEAALRTKLLIASHLSNEHLVAQAALKLLEAIPTDPDAAAMVVMMEEDDDKVLQIIDSLDPKAIQSPAILQRAISLWHNNLPQLLRYAYTNGFSEKEEWRELADYAFEIVNPDAIPQIFQVYEEMADEPLDHDFLLLKIMFVLGNYQMAINIFCNDESTGTLRNRENFFKAFSIYFVSLLRMGNFETAKNSANELIKALDNEPSLPGSELEKKAMRDYVNDIIKRIDSEQKTDWDKFNPYFF